MARPITRTRNFVHAATFCTACLLLAASGCRTVTETLPESAAVLSSAGVIGIRADNSNGDFEIDLFVVDTNGKSVTSLGDSAFVIPNSFQNLFTPTGVATLLSTPMGPYSAEILLDQSGSIRKTDPFNLRLLASRLFLELVGSNDEVQLATFQDSLHNGDILMTYGGFTSQTEALEDSVDLLRTRVGGGTPLYRAMYMLTDTVALQAHNQNKVMLVFTDGEDNESYETLRDVVDHAIDKKVKVFAVALKTGLDSALIHLAMKTGGGVMHADDAQQMVPYYKALGGLLHGNVSYYRTRWHTSAANAASLSGQTVTGNVAIKQNNTQVMVPFSVTFP
jgi:hypothetical protein